MASYLSHKGYVVKVVCSHFGTRRTVSAGGFVTDYHRSLWQPFMARWGIADYHIFPLTTLKSLLRERFDVVHCFNFTDAMVAAWARRIRGARVVLHLTAIPPDVPYRKLLSTGGAILCRAVNSVDGLITVSKEQQKYFERRCRRVGINIPGPVDTDVFALCTQPREHSIVCASALADPRKGARVLMRAFSLLKECEPDTRLKIASPLTDALRDELLALVPGRWHTAIEFIRDGADLPKLFGTAGVVVIPSLWETVSLVMLEALATGTPVVATRPVSGHHEVIHSQIGRTFEPGPTSIAEPSNVEGLAQALREALYLSRRPETALRCRQAIDKYSWRTVGPQYEDVYRNVIGRNRPART
jgi:phosphatidyl-myo-inositol alpha-mannosyltransferase